MEIQEELDRIWHPKQKIDFEFEEPKTITFQYNNLLKIKEKCFKSNSENEPHNLKQLKLQVELDNPIKLIL